MHETTLERRYAVPRLAQDHLGLTVSATLIALALINILAVARYDLAAMRAVISVADRTSVLLAAAGYAASTAAMMAIINPIARRWVFQGLKPQAPLRHEFVAAAFIVFGIPLIFSTFSLSVVLGLGIAVSITTLSRRFARGRGRLSADGRIEVSETTKDVLDFVILMIGLTLVLSLMSRPWVPRENLELNDGTQLSGHILGEQASEFLVRHASERGHAFSWIRTTEIAEREICTEEKTWMTRTFGDWLGVVNHPRCLDSVGDRSASS